MRSIQKTLIVLVLCGFFIVPESRAGQNENEQISGSGAEQVVQILDLEQCINLALKNNHLAKISIQTLKIAEAQYQQVMSSYWPQISASANYIRLDEAPIFIYPEETSDYVISGLLAMPMEVSVTVPEKRTKLMDRTKRHT